jgi:hypothetical protein
MHLLPVEVSDVLPLLASVVWGTLQWDDGSYLFCLVEERLWTETNDASVVQ